MITTIFEDVRNSANESQRQIISFIKIGSSNVFADSSLIYRTWNCQTLEQAINQICDAYKNEYELKVKVMENIAHSRTDDELAMHLGVWQYQTHVTTEIELLFKALTVEADVQCDAKT